MRRNSLLSEDLAGGDNSFISSVSGTTRAADSRSIDGDSMDGSLDDSNDCESIGSEGSDEDEESGNEDHLSSATRSTIDKFLDSLTNAELADLFDSLPPIPIVLVSREEMTEIIRRTAGV